MVGRQPPGRQMEPCEAISRQVLLSAQDKVAMARRCIANTRGRMRSPEITPVFLVIRVCGSEDRAARMNETHREDPHAPLSYHGARRIVWLVIFVFIIWLILRALQPVILLFALVFLLAMVLNPIIVWLQKHRVPRFLGVILVMLALIAVTTTIILFAIPPVSRQLQELMPRHGQPVARRPQPDRVADAKIIRKFARHCHERMKWPVKSGQLRQQLEISCYSGQLGLVGGVASALLAILLLVFVLANPRPLIAAYLALTGDSLSRAGASHAGTNDAANDCLGAGRRDQWRYHRRVNRFAALVGWGAAGAYVWRICVSR